MRHIEVFECVEIECADGKWRTIHSMPWGMTTTGQSRIVGYALTDGNTSFGQRRATRDEAQAAADAENARLAECERHRLKCIAERDAELAARRSAISKAQAVAIFGGCTRLIPKRGTIKPQPADGRYLIGQTREGTFFTMRPAD